MAYTEPYHEMQCVSILFHQIIMCTTKICRNPPQKPNLNQRRNLPIRTV